ncbi:MAG: gamma-glutamylcyclotransferase family protein, partial [Bacillus sp. (in: firmicutes)]
MGADEKYLVFVYGTLRRHESNHHLLKEACCLAQQAWTKGILYDTGLGYPALKDSNDGVVYGELYEIDFQQLKAIDELEDYLGPGQNNLYNRGSQTVSTDKGDFEAFVYSIHPDQEGILKQIIPLGDWTIYN